MARQVLLASVAAFALAGSAFAADLPSQAPPAPPAPEVTWTGFYAGVSAGYTWGQSDELSTSAHNVQFCDPAVCEGTIVSVLTSIWGASGVWPLKTDGFIGGGQAGYNYQLASNFVVGVEADFQGIAGSSRSASGGSNCRNSGIFPPDDPEGSNNFIGTAVAVRKSIDYLGTLRGRLGYLVTPTFLVYGTGGLAYGGAHSNTSILQTLSGETGGTLETEWNSAGSYSSTRVGWVAGGGGEWMFAPNWSVKAEYLYYDLGNATYSGGVLVDQFTALGAVPPNPAFFSNAVRSSTRFNGQIIRVGLNYHFNWGGAPVVAKY